MPSCKSFYEDLVTCLLKSDCVRKEGRTVKECLQREHNDSVPEECRHLQKSFVECKRNMWNMSRRFRGSFGTDYNKLKAENVDDDEL